MELLAILVVRWVWTDSYSDSQRHDRRPETRGCVDRRRRHRPRAREPTRRILTNVSGEALPSELLVLMGPSGAGKSTLLDCIAGRNRGCTGTVLVNGSNWNARLSQHACYVLQDDLFYANLTVREHFAFQAQLRASGRDRVDAVISELGLSVCQHTRIGDAAMGAKGLSSGQRKRLSLATELLTNPSLLFVDEPTSGLDSFMAETVVKQMRALARRGRTAVATIHQPSSQLFALFDRLFLLVNSRTVYHGRSDASIAYFASVGHPCPSFMNPADHFMAVLAVTDDRPGQAQVVTTLVDAWQQADGHESKQRRASVFITAPEALAVDNSRHGVLRWFRQLQLLSRHHWFRLVRDDVLFKARVASTLFVTVLAGLVFCDLQRDQKGIHDFTGAMFFIAVSQLFLYANPELTTVPLEIPLILREHHGSLYHIWTWFLAKNLAELPLQLGLPLLFLAPMYFLMGFDHSLSMFFQFYGYTVAAASCATALGYFVSCLSRRVDLAPASTPPYFKWLQALSPFMYVFQCLMRVFWPRVETIACRAGQFCVAMRGVDVLAMHEIAYGAHSQRDAIAYLLAINVGFRVLGAWGTIHESVAMLGMWTTHIDRACGPTAFLFPTATKGRDEEKPALLATLTMEPAGDSIVLEEEIDPNYEPTEKEVHEYASWLGMDLETEQDLFWIAREGLKAPLPENWKPCKTTDTEEIYYFNFATGQSTWDHPCDEYYRKVYDDHKKKRSSTARGGGAADGDERKKKEKEDVAELLGKKPSKKKKGATAKATTEPLGPPVLARGAALGEKKPLPGLSSGKLKGLSSGALGSASALRPVASLGRLKGEPKDNGESSAVDDDGDEDDESERKPSPRALSKPPLGSLLTKKALPSTLSKADSKAVLDDVTAGFDQKKQTLVDDHAKALRELETAHEAQLSDHKKKAQQELDDLREQEDAKLKQRRKDFDKKMNDIENQYDKDESNLLRERKEKLKRLESDMETTLAQKKQELERDHQKETQRVQSRLDAKLEELKDDYERQEKALKQKTDGLSNAADLASEVEKLKSELRRFEQQATDTTNELETLRRAHAASEERYATATRQLDELKKQLKEANDELTRQQSRAADPAAVKKEAQECTECPEKARRIVEFEVELDRERQEVQRTRASLADLQRELNGVQEALNAERKAPAGGSADAEAVVTLRQVETDLRRDLKALETKHATEMSDWKAKCTLLEQQKEQLIAKAKEATAARAAEAEGSRADELEALHSEIADLQDQVAVLTTTNAQVKEQLLKEANEKKQLREQIDNASALADDSSRELALKVDQQQREMDSLQKRLQTEMAAKGQELQALHEQLRTAQQGAEQTKRRLEAEISRLESENRQLSADAAMLKRQMEERLSEAAEAGDAAEQQATAAAKWELEQLQLLLKLVTRDKEELALRVGRLETELDAATQAKHQAELERDTEASRSKKKEIERETIQQKLTGVQEELDTHVNKARVASSETAELKSQLSKLKFKEQAMQDKQAQLEDDVKAFEATAQALQSDVERLTRELRAKALEVDAKTATLRDVQGEMEVLNDQLSDAKRQLSEWRARTPATPHSLANGSSEVADLRVRVSELEANVESLTQEKAQLVDKQRVLTQKQSTADASVRALEAERDRLVDECHSAAQDAAKWKERLDKKTKEAEQLKADLGSAQSDRELVELALAKEKDEKRDVAAQKTQLDKTKKQLDATIESLTAQLAEMEKTQGCTASEAQALRSKLKRVESELETMDHELRQVQDERDAVTARFKQQTTDMAALETRVRLLRTEANEQNARTKASEDDASRQAETIKRLEMQLNDKDARLRKESDERDALTKQLTALRSDKEELETDLLAIKRKNESVEAKYKDHESAASRGDFQLKLRVQQLEAERDGVATGKERAEQHAKGAEKELLRAKEELSTATNELETLRTRVKALTLERDDFQTALLQAQASNATVRGVGIKTGEKSGTTDAMLVRLQLADVNKSELEQHLADVATQLEFATRRCTLAEARGRDQSVEIESLHVEIASLRSSMAKMHLSALETLPLVERLEYEHRKRTLKRDFSAQLRDFQEREEHATMRQKARVRVQHEKQIEELVDELDAKKQRRLEAEEQVTVQMLSQLRSERDAQVKAMRKQVETELLEEERVLMDRKERRRESVAAAVRQDEEDTRARWREERQIQREQALAEGGDSVDVAETNESGKISPGQVRPAASSHKKPSARRATAARKPQSSSSDNESDDSEREARKYKAPQRRKRRSEHRHDHDIERWRQRIADETALLDKAKTLVVNQKKQLQKQADKVKKDKAAWKREWADVESSGDARGHRVAILHEMRGMIDHRAASWRTSAQQLRERDEWIQTREVKLRKMRRALASLRDRRRRSRSRSRSRGRETKKSVRFGSASSSSSSDVDDIQDVDSDAVLDKLARLDGELASDASEFSSDDRWATRPSPSYRFPLSVAFSEYPSDATPRVYRSPSLSPSLHAWENSASTRWSQRVWPTTATRLRTTTKVSDAAVQRRIARWAHDREAMQHAATKQATWLSGLYQEVKAYGDTRAAQASDTPAAMDSIQ